MALDEALTFMTLLGILGGFVALVASIYQLVRLVRVLQLGRQGTLFTLTQVTIKAWAASVLLYFAIGTFLRGVGGIPSDIRQWINPVLAWLLVTQAIWATVMYRRWRLGPRRQQRTTNVPVGEVTVQEAVDIVREQQAENAKQLEAGK